MSPGLAVRSMVAALFVGAAGVTSTDCSVIGADVVLEVAEGLKTTKGTDASVFFFFFFRTFVPWVALFLSGFADESCDGVPKTVTCAARKTDRPMKPTVDRPDCAICFLLQGWPTD